MKRGVVLVSIFLMILLVGFVVAQDGGEDNDGENIPPEGEGGGGGEGVSVDDGKGDEIDKLIAEAENFDEEFEGSAGLTPDDGILYDLFDGFIESREEKIAEMIDTSERCSQGDDDACAALEVSYEKYKEHAEEFEREVSPDERDEAERSSRAIRGVVVREIAQNAPPGLKDDLIRDIVKREDRIEIAADIAAEIDSLCDRLVNELGDYKRASKVCNLGGDEDDIPDWKKKKIKEWKESMTEDGKKFFEVLKGCAIDDDCDCNEMPGDVQVDLCFQIIELEDAGGDGGELINQFRESLPEDLREIMDRVMEEFEEEDYDRGRRPPECEGLDFKECMLVMVESELQNAPEPCREPIRQGIRDGTVRGERDGRRICEEIMFEQGGGDIRRKCEDRGITDPGECAELFGGRGRGGPGPGFDYTVCDAIEDIQSQLNCYKDNTRRADFAGDYYDERHDDRGRGDFDSREFDRKYYDEHGDDLAGFARRDYDYQYEGDHEGPSGGREEHQAKIDAFFNSEEYRKGSAEGRPWFCDGPPEKPCYLGEAYNYPEYDYEGDRDHDDRDYDSPPYDCSVMYCDNGYCDPYQGCVSDGDYDDYNPEDYNEGELGSFGPGDYDGGEYGGDYDGSGSGNYEGGDSGGYSGSDGGGGDSSGSGGDSGSSGSGGDGGGSSGGDGGDSSTTGSVIKGISGRAILDNKFLKYYFRR